MIQTDRRHRISVLSIAGSDSGGGAGIQADLKTFAAFGLHGLTAICALTAQNTRGVSRVTSTQSDMIDAQIDAVFADFDIAAVKIGMLGDAATIRSVACALQRHAPRHVVLDPVMIATSGAALLQDDAVATLIEQLLPLATVITPNLPEAARLLRDFVHIDASAIDSDPAAACSALRELGAAAVLLKGGHAQGSRLHDWLDDGNGLHDFEHPRLPGEGHGTGCTLASALACGLALGAELVDAGRVACDYVHAAFANGYQPGRGGLIVLDHFSPAACAVAAIERDQSRGQSPAAMSAPSSASRSIEN